MGERKQRRESRDRAFRGYYEKLLNGSGIGQTEEFLQHGSTTRLAHSAAVAYYSFRLAKWTGISFREEELVRGALLHDYYLYDAKEKNPATKGHWTRHPEIALKNAEHEVKLTQVERDIIRTHMFPLTPKPPRYREGVVVTMVDKGCSIYEFFNRRNPYSRLCRKLGMNG